MIAPFTLWSPPSPPICSGVEMLHSCPGGDTAATAFAVLVMAATALVAARRVWRRVA